MKAKKIFRIMLLIIICVIAVITAGCGALSFLVYSVILGPKYDIYNEYDHFADDLEIPDNIEINIPKGEKHPEIAYKPETNEFKDFIDIELYYGLQGGIYWYHAWINNLEAGKIFLKAYEYTGNIELSSRRLLQATEIEIDNIGENVIIIGPKHFTIYEGDWDKYYVARFELWYKPIDNTKYEMKLLEKYYLIEGWSR